MTGNEYDPFLYAQKKASASRGSRCFSMVMPDYGDNPLYPVTMPDLPGREVPGARKALLPDVGQFTDRPVLNRVIVYPGYHITGLSLYRVIGRIRQFDIYLVQKFEQMFHGGIQLLVDAGILFGRIVVDRDIRFHSVTFYDPFHPFGII